MSCRSSLHSYALIQNCRIRVHDALNYDVKLRYAAHMTSTQLRWTFEYLCCRLLLKTNLADCRVTPSRFWMWSDGSWRKSHLCCGTCANIELPPSTHTHKWVNISNQYSLKRSSSHTRLRARPSSASRSECSRFLARFVSPGKSSWQSIAVTWRQRMKREA